MSQVDQLQNAEEAVEQARDEAAKAQRAAAQEDLRRAPLADTADKRHTMVSAPLAQVRTMVNMRVGALPELHELAVSIKETGLLHPPLVRATGEEDKPYELLAGRRRFAAMQLLDAAEQAREWRFTLVDDISRREALTMQFAENFHQQKPEPVMFARAARAIMAEDPSLTAADVSRMVGAPAAWTRKALSLLDLPEGVVERVERGDLSITVADIVRRGIARGDVSASDAEALVEEHAEGKITGGALKLGVGYVPPKPKDYDEQSRKLDEARYAEKQARERENGSGGRGGKADADADQRDWDRDDAPIRAARGAEGGAGVAGVDAESLSQAPSVEDLDAFLLGLVLSRIAAPAHRAALGLREDEDPRDYAAALPPSQRLGALRHLAARLLAEERRPSWG